MFETRHIEMRIRGLKRFREELPDVVAGELVRQVREYAASGVTPSGQAWPQLTEPYAIRKMKLVGNRLPNKKVTGAFLASVKNRNGIIAPDAAHLPQGMGLEKKRVSFEASPVTAQNIERLILKKFNSI